MKKIKKGNKIYEIDCDDRMCGNCSFKPTMPEQKCELFDILLDHLGSGLASNSGWKRCPKCINAEV